MVDLLGGNAAGLRRGHDEEDQEGLHRGGELGGHVVPFPVRHPESAEEIHRRAGEIVKQPLRLIVLLPFGQRFFRGRLPVPYLVPEKPVKDVIHGGDEPKDSQQDLPPQAAPLLRLRMPFLHDHAYGKGRIAYFVDVHVRAAIHLRLQDHGEHLLERIAVPEIDVRVLRVAERRDGKGHLLQAGLLRTKLQQGVAVQVGKEVEIPVGPVVNEVLAGDEIPSEGRGPEIPQLPDFQRLRIDGVQVVVVLRGEFLFPGQVAAAAEHVQEAVHDVGSRRIARSDVRHHRPEILLGIVQVTDNQLVLEMIMSIAAKAVQGVDAGLPRVGVVPVAVVPLRDLLVLPAAGLEIESGEQVLVQVVGREPVVAAAHVEQLVGEIRRAVPARDRNLRQLPGRGVEHMDRLVPAGHVELVPVVEGDGRDIAEGVREYRLEGDVPVDQPLRVHRPGGNAPHLVVAQVAVVAGALPVTEQFSVPVQPDVPDAHRSHVPEGITGQLAQAEGDPESLRPLGARIPDGEGCSVIVQVDLAGLRVQGHRHMDPLLQGDVRPDLVHLFPGDENGFPAVVQVRRVHQVHVLSLVGDDAEDASEHVLRAVVQVEGHLQGLSPYGNLLPVLQREAGELMRMRRIGDDMEAVVQPRLRDIDTVRHSLRRRREKRRAGQQQRAKYSEHMPSHPGFRQV